jgi:hypothetical protein
LLVDRSTYFILLWLSLGFCIFSLMSSLGLALLDWFGCRKKPKRLIYPSDVVGFNYAGNFPFELWLIFGLYTFFHASFFLFLNISVPFLDLQTDTQTVIRVILQNLSLLVAIICSPIAGFASWYFGRLTLFCESHFFDFDFDF